MIKPTPRQGYRLLIDAKDTTSVTDLIWIIDKSGSRRWVPCIMQSDEGLCMATDTGVLYKEPKTL